MKKTTDNKHNYEQIVTEALNEPGKLNSCYSNFWRYSMGNQWLAMMQLAQPEPINTYKGWQGLGRQVKKGEKAIALLMPVTSKDKETGEVNGMFFISRNNWFGLSQTDGEAYTAETVPGFDLDRALAALNITQEAFKAVDGNCQGYAKTSQQVIAISPLAVNPIKTTLHEIAHCLLHADQDLMNDADTLAKDVKEVEAELTASIVSSVLGRTEGLQFSRGYIQAWMQDVDAEKVRYGKVFGAVDKILKAGREQVEA